MHAGKKYTLWQILNWSKKYIFIFIVIDSVPVILYKLFGFTWISIPWQPIPLVGIAVAFYLGFKNNSSYERLWEARKIWGGIVNTSRSLAIKTRDFITDEFAEASVSDQDLKTAHRTILHRHIAWLKTLTLQLRELKAWEHHSQRDNDVRRVLGTHKDDLDFEEVKPYISKEEYQYLLQKGNKASHLISLQSKHFMRLKRKGLIDDFRHMDLENELKELYQLQGKSERIKNFPFPRQYASVNYFFVWIFVLLLPFAMLDVFSENLNQNFIWGTIPFTVLVSWVFYLMEMVGDYSENPFEGLYNDVPITSMTRSIEIDIREMLDETDLPDPIVPAKNSNILI